MPTAALEQPQAEALPVVVVAGLVCLDLIPDLPGEVSMEPGTLTRIGPASVAAGGCVANVGLALHQLGRVRPRLVAQIGDDALAPLLLEQFRAADPALGTYISRVHGAATSYSVVVAPGSADRLFWHCPGANELFRPGQVDHDAFANADWLHVGYPPVMRGFYGDGGEGCARLFERARAAGLRTSLDFCSIDPGSDAAGVDWSAWLRRVLPHVDMFVPSFDEIAAALSLSGEATPTSAESLAERLRHDGASRVVLKLGEAGLLAVDEDGRAYAHPCFAVDVAGTTGSGDATIAGLITALCRGQPLDTALRFACAVGAAGCEHPDATSGVPDAKTIESRLASGWPLLPPPTAPSSDP